MFVDDDYNMYGGKYSLEVRCILLGKFGFISTAKKSITILFLYSLI